MQFSIGNVMGRGWKVLMSEFLALLVLSLIFYVPLMIYSAVVLGDMQSAVTKMAETGETTLDTSWSTNLIVLSVLSVLAAFMLQAAITYTVFQRLREKDVSIGQALSVGLARLFPVIGVSIVVGLCVGLGFLLFVVPGLILLCVLFVAVPASVVEKPGVFGALGRSADLTRGARWAIFGLVVVFWALGFVSNKLFEQLMSAENIATIAIASMAVTMLVQLYQSVCVVVAYHDLRVEKEGLDTDAIAAVFD